MSLKGISKLQRAEHNLEGVTVPLRPTPLVLQSLVSRWAGWEVRTTRCCMSLQVRFLLEQVYMAGTHRHRQPHERKTHTHTHTEKHMVRLLKSWGTQTDQTDVSDNPSHSWGFSIYMRWLRLTQFDSAHQPSTAGILHFHDNRATCLRVCF